MVFVNPTTGKQVLTILELEGMYPDTTLEDAIFAAQSPHAHDYEVRFVRGNLSVGGDGPMMGIESLSDELCKSVDGLMVFRHYLTRKDIDRFTQCKVVVRMGVGYDRLDRVALGERNITVCNVPDYGTNEIADHALALALSLRRGILLHHELQRSDPPAPWQVIDTPLVSRLQKAVFGIVGLGRIGTAVALRAKAFGWDVIFYDPYLSNGVDKALQLTRVRSLAELFQRASTVSLHCPHTRETRRLIDSSLLSLLQPGSVLINTSRGEVVDLDGVEEALRSGKLAGVALDVLPVEPIPDDEAAVHPLIKAYRAKDGWLRGRMVLTPHSAFHSPESLFDIRIKSAQTMREVLIDGLDTNVILPTME
ncbi:hypothetical protein JCM1840_003572 [Sporobolomyces johnsonii]